MEEIPHAKVVNEFSDVEEEIWDNGGIYKAISNLFSDLQDSTPRMFLANLEILPDKINYEFEKEFKKNKLVVSDDLGLQLQEDIDLRCSFFDKKIFFWKRDSNPVNLINGYGELYFYFRDKQTLVAYLNDVSKSLGIAKSDITRPTARHLDGLLSRLVPESKNTLTNTIRNNRILGKHMQLLNDISGKKLSNLEKQISRVAKRSGRGGIDHPRFPDGNELEVAIAKVTGVAVTDCHLKPNGTLEYYEPDLGRVRIVEKDLQKFGVIWLNSRFEKARNYYVSYIPTPIGKLLQHLGIPYGNKSIQNIGLFSEIHTFHDEALRKFVGEVVSQDGTVRAGRISWSHSNALNPGSKGLKYRIGNAIGNREISLIKRHGRKEEYCWALGLGKIRELKKNIDSERDSQLAAKLESCIRRNRNELIDGGLRIAKQLEIKMDTKPYSIRYHKRTGKVSVDWRIFTINKNEALKLAIIAPPNDIIKRGILQKWLKEEAVMVENIRNELTHQGISIEQWWK